MVCLICVPAFKCQPIGYEDDTVEGKRKEQAFISSERPSISRAGGGFKFGENKPLKLVNYQLPPPPRLQRVNPRQAKRPGAIPTRKRMILIRRLTGGETTNDATLRRNEQPVQEKPGQPYRKTKKPPPRQSPLGGRGRRRTPARPPPMREGMERGAAAAGASEDGWIWSSGRRRVLGADAGAQVWGKWSDGERPLGIRLYESVGGFFFPNQTPQIGALRFR